VRVAKNLEAIYGVLIQGSIPFAVTLEDPLLWIRAGAYKCGRVNSPRFGNTFEVKDVSGRTHILFHKGNTEEDTRGCILVGESFNPVLGRPGITSSKEGFAEFLNITSTTNEFPLEITEAFT
jgi:hypothetical protein